MTAEQKVKQMYPEAFAHRIGAYVYIIAKEDAKGSLGSSAHRSSWAWADAWSNIQKGKAGQ